MKNTINENIEIMKLVLESKKGNPVTDGMKSVINKKNKNPIKLSKKDIKKPLKVVVRKMV